MESGHLQVGSCRWLPSTCTSFDADFPQRSAGPDQYGRRRRFQRDRQPKIGARRPVLLRPFRAAFPFFVTLHLAAASRRYILHVCTFFLVATTRMDASALCTDGYAAARRSTRLRSRHRRAVPARVVAAPVFRRQPSQRLPGRERALPVSARPDSLRRCCPKSPRSSCHPGWPPFGADRSLRALRGGRPERFHVTWNVLAQRTANRRRRCCRSLHRTRNKGTRREHGHMAARNTSGTREHGHTGTRAHGNTAGTRAQGRNTETWNTGTRGTWVTGTGGHGTRCSRELELGSRRSRKNDPLDIGRRRRRRRCHA
jgi:hypothetical protein